MTNVIQFQRTNADLLAKVQLAVAAGVKSALEKMSNDELKALVLSPYRELAQEETVKLDA